MRESVPFTEKGREGLTLKLSKRMQAVADMVTEGNRVCDVGCDHGFVSIYLVRKGISPKVIAMDVNKGPLQAAGVHVREYGLEDYIETRLSDGVKAFAGGEAETLVCAGMGGRLIMKIMEEGKDKLLAMKELILQPQSEIQAVREYLREKGYGIADEDMVFEDGKYYPIIKVLPELSSPVKAEPDGLSEEGEKPEIDAVDRQRVEDKYCPVLLKKKSPVLETYLHREASLCTQIMENLRTNGKGKEKRQEEIEDRIKDIETALAYYQ